MKRLVTVALIIAVMASVASAVSFPVTGSNLTGDRKTPSSQGLIGSGAWCSSGKDGGIEISWNISENTHTGIWNYSYTFTECGGASLKDSVCHMLLEVSSSITASNFCTVIGDANCCITAPETYTCSSKNPGLPSSIYAVELSDQPSETFSFECTHSPMWGSFYAIDGSCGTYVWNSGIGGYPTSSGGPFTGWIPVPDTVSTATQGIPEPATMALLGLGLIGVFARRKIART